MNILLLEDKGSRLDEMKEHLEDHGYTVYPCQSVNIAKDIWKKYSGNINCAIVDLAMDTAGLNDSSDTENGYYTGWIFLKETILSDRPNFVKNCLIVSAWTDSFKRYFDTPEKRKHITEEQLISKNDPDVDDKLIEWLKNTKMLSSVTMQKNNK